MTKFHCTMAIIWACLSIPTMLYWKDSVLWVALMSLYANIGVHWGAYQAARAEDIIKESKPTGIIFKSKLIFKNEKIQ